MEQFVYLSELMNADGSSEKIYRGELDTLCYHLNDEQDMEKQRIHKENQDM